VVFLGALADESGSSAIPNLYIMDISSGRVRTLAPALLGAFTQSFSIPLAVSADGKSVFTSVPAGDLYQVVEIRRDSGARTVVLSLTTQPWFLDAGPDGALYIDQCQRSLELLKFQPLGGSPIRIARSNGSTRERLTPLGLRDGRVVFTNAIAGRTQLVTSRAGDDPAPLVETSEETNGPATLVGTDNIAFFIGSATESTLALATTDGRILHRFPGIKGNGISSVAASPDGQTLYVADSGSLWAISLQNDQRQKIGQGYGVAVDPRNGELVVQVRTSAGAHLLRLTPPNGKTRDLKQQGEYWVTPWATFSGGSIDSSGRILATVDSSRSWFDRPGVIDPGSGAITPVKLNYDGDVQSATWGPDGTIIAAGIGINAAVWRMRHSAAGP
jgi:DNA-binding beta-propeller fold protein YncE